MATLERVDLEQGILLLLPLWLSLLSGSLRYTRLILFFEVSDTPAWPPWRKTEAVGRTQGVPHDRYRGS